MLKKNRQKFNFGRLWAKFSKIKVFAELFGQSPSRHPKNKMVDIGGKYI